MFCFPAEESGRNGENRRVSFGSRERRRKEDCLLHRCCECCRWAGSRSVKALFGLHQQRNNQTRAWRRVAFRFGCPKTSQKSPYLQFAPLFLFLQESKRKMEKGGKEFESRQPRFSRKIFSQRMSASALRRPHGKIKIIPFPRRRESLRRQPHLGGGEITPPPEAKAADIWGHPLLPAYENKQVPNPC